MALVSNPKDGDNVSIRQAIAKLGSSKLGPTSTPVYAGLTLTELTASRLLASDASKELVSTDLNNWVTGTANEINIADDGDGTITIGIVNPLIVGKGGTGTNTLTNHGILLGSGTDAITPLGVAANGQIPIGSTGADPVLATLTGTAKQVIVTNAAGSITLSGPQDLDTVDSPTFAGLTVTNCGVLGSNSVVFQPFNENVTFFEINNPAGASIFNVNTTGRQVTIGYTSAIYPFTINSSDASDQIRLYHDNSRPYIKWTDGELRLQTDEGTDTITQVEIRGKGTKWGQIQIYDAGNVNYFQGRCISGIAQFYVTGDSPASFSFQPAANVPILFFNDAEEGKTPEFRLSGFGNGFGGKETINISVEQYAANTADFMGLDNYMFGGNLITKNFTHENSDGGGETNHDFMREDGAGTESVAARIQGSHDGTGANDTKGKVVIATDGGAGLVDRVEIDSAGNTKIGDAGTTNYTKVEADGTVEFNGAATVWNDENLGAAFLSKPAASQPDEDNFMDEGGVDTGITTLAFAIGEKASGSFEIPHSYKNGSDFTFHVHWQGITAPAGGTDNVQWRLTYTLQRDDQTLDAVTVIDSSDSAIDAQYKFIRTDIVVIDGSTKGNNGGNVLMGDQFLFTLERVAATADDYAGDALVATIGIHYEQDTVGSREILTK